MSPTLRFDRRQQQKVFLKILYDGHIHALTEFTGNVQWTMLIVSRILYCKFVYQR